MTIMAIMLTIGIVVGCGLLLYGAFFMKKVEDDTSVIADVVQTDTLEQLKQSVMDADNTLSNLNSVSSLIIEEIDIKYKEMLFLYEMMEERKRGINSNTPKAVEKPVLKPENNYVQAMNAYAAVNAPYIQPSEQDDIEIEKIERRIEEVKRFPKLKNQAEILSLYSNGWDITDIAKSLGIGKGEVNFILGLSKVGAANE